MNLTKEEIIDGNKLIGELMGHLNIKVDNGEVICHVETPNGWAEQFPRGLILVLKYHEHWEKLMEVFDKINGMGKEYSFAIFKTYVALSIEKGGKVYKDFSFAHSEYVTPEQTTKEAMFKLIVKYVKWHNENIMPKNLVESK